MGNFNNEPNIRKIESQEFNNEPDKSLEISEKNRELSKDFTSVHERTTFKCDYCQSNLKTKKIFKKHISSIHEAKRQEFKCFVCSLSFLQKGTLKTHVESDHEGKRYKCDFCTSKFKQKGNLNDHITSAHEGKTINAIKCGHSVRSAHLPRADVCQLSQLTNNFWDL